MSFRSPDLSMDSWLSSQIQQLKSNQLERVRITTQPLPDGRCCQEGKVLWDFASNDYLGLAADHRVKQAAIEAIEECGVGARASSLISGWTDYHEQLRITLADFEQVEDVAIFPTGYAASLGMLGALIQENDVIFCERLNHACLVDGAKASPASLKVFRVDQLDKLESALQRYPTTGKRWLITDSVFSMDGTIAPLTDLAEIAQRYDTQIIVDEAHATGIYGQNRRGLVELERLADIITIRMGTLSKAVGSQGGFVLGSEPLIKWLWNQSHTLMFSTGLSIPNCAAATAAIKIIQIEGERAERVKSHAVSLRSQLVESGIPVLGSNDCPILPIILNDPKRALELSQQLWNDGFLVGTIRPPTVPKGTSRLRISLSAAHTPETINQLADALHKHLTN